MLLAAKRNEPLGLRNTPARTSATSLPSPYPPSRGSSRGPAPPKKRTADGAIVLDPQPEESMNDPLNWPVWRRDLAMLCLGFYCMLGGGMTPILAAAYNEVSAEYSISFHKVALTTGLYMLGLGLGSVVMSPTAILYGKRPVYIAGATMFIISAVWCAVSPSYVSLVIARIFQGLAVSPVECLPSATIAEIYFLHERAYRVGVYTLLLLGGKNLIPLVSAAITNSLGWRWIFWYVLLFPFLLRSWTHKLTSIGWLLSPLDSVQSWCSSLSLRPFGTGLHVLVQRDLLCEEACLTLYIPSEVGLRNLSLLE